MIFVADTVIDEVSRLRSQFARFDEHGCLDCKRRFLAFAPQYCHKYVMPARAPARVASGSVSLSVCVISVYRDVYMVV